VHPLPLHIGYRELHKLILARNLIQFKAALGNTVEAKSAKVPSETDINGHGFNNSAGMSRTPLHLAVEEELPEYVQAILEAATPTRRVKVNQAQLEGFTALHLAARKGNVEIAKMLIAAGATIEGTPEGGTISLAEPTGGIWPNKTGETPLLLAVFHHNPAMVVFLLENGADFKRAGQTSALDVAADNGDEEIVSLLLTKQWDQEQLDKALWKASKAGFTSIVKKLLMAGAGVTYKTTNGTSPLAAASQEGHVEIMEMLLESTAEVNAVRTDGASPLYLAVMGKQPAAVRLLLAHNADTSLVRTTDDTTALSLAQKRNLTDIVALLSGEKH